MSLTSSLLSWPVADSSEWPRSVNGTGEYSATNPEPNEARLIKIYLRVAIGRPHPLPYQRLPNSSGSTLWAGGCPSPLEGFIRTVSEIAIVRTEPLSNSACYQLRGEHLPIPPQFGAALLTTVSRPGDSVQSLESLTDHKKLEELVVSE